MTIKLFVVGAEPETNAKEIFIDQAVKSTYEQHINIVKQTIVDTCIAIMRYIPASFYQRENLRGAHLDGVLAVILTSKLAIYHGLRVDIAPGNVTLVMEEADNLSSSALNTLKTLKQQYLTIISTPNEVDDGEKQRKLAEKEAEIEALNTRIKGGTFRSDLASREDFEALREYLYPHLQYIAEDERVLSVTKAYLEKQNVTGGLISHGSTSK